MDHIRGEIEMKEIRHWICEMCGTQFADKCDALKCESGHKKDLTIVGARYLPITVDATGLPTTITVEYQDRKTTKRVTYKR